MTSLDEKKCRSCDVGGGLIKILDLGNLPLANSLLSEADLAIAEPRFPLVLAFCPSCSLLQITHEVPPEVLFRNYVYFSSVSESMVLHAKSLVDKLVRMRGLHRGSFVVELASNDGYLLQHYLPHGVPVLGVEPAVNVARVAIEKKNIPTVPEFFTEDLAHRLVRTRARADVVHANNVLAHVADLNGFVRGIRDLLHPAGIGVIEVPYAHSLIEHGEFDTIYHEHLCYFSLTAIAALVRRHGLAVVDVEHLTVHGGSMRVFVAHQDSATFREPSADVEQWLEREQTGGVATLGMCTSFAKRVECIKSKLVEALRDIRRCNRRVAAYGAAAKGTTLLNVCGIGHETLDFVVDRSPHKQGRYMPGVRVPIVGVEQLVSRQPDVCLMLAWNIAEEILQQQRAYRERGGTFLIPLPQWSMV